MAVEVANVTLWLASFVPGLALSYLGSNLKCGDALIGVADPSVVGASDSPLFTGQTVRNAMEQAAALQREQAAVPDRTPEEVKAVRGVGFPPGRSHSRPSAAFDLWTAEPLGLGGARHTLETPRVTPSYRERTRVYCRAVRQRSSKLRRPQASPPSTASSTGPWSFPTSFTVSALALTWWWATHRGTRVKFEDA